jgi:hypothetical protein
MQSFDAATVAKEYRDGTLAPADVVAEAGQFSKLKLILSHS